MNYVAADNFFTPRHARLKLLADIARIASIIIPILHIFYFFGALNLFIGNGGIPGISLYQQLGYISQHATESAIFALDWFNILLRGFIYLIVLQGVSLGLKMIIETNLNTMKNARRSRYE